MLSLHCQRSVARKLSLESMEPRIVMAAASLEASTTTAASSAVLDSSPAGSIPPLTRPAPPLAAPSGTIVHVASEAQLQTAIANLQSNTTVLIEPGTYTLTSQLHVHDVQNVVIRGASGRRDDVVLLGRGMNNADYAGVPSVFLLRYAQDVTIADLTIRDVWFHCLSLNEGTERPRLHNLHLVNAGEQFVKSNPDGLGGGVDGGVVEYCLIEYATTAKNDYTNGVDVHAGDGWVVCNNVFRNIRAPAGQLAGPAVLMWKGSRNSVTTGNVFLNTQRAIAYGLLDGAASDHRGGMIRNNFIYRSAAQSGDVGIGVFNSPDTQVQNNTIVLSGTYPNAIEYRFAGSTGLKLQNNLTDAAIVARDGATGLKAGNITSAQPDWFVNSPAGDLHLARVSPAVDTAVAVNITKDFDGQSRPALLADVGADEYLLNQAPLLGLSGSVGYTRGAPAVALAPAATVTDLDSANFGGGELRVRIASGGGPNNTLAIGGGFTIDAYGNVKQGSLVIGQRTSSGVGTSELRITFTTNATRASVQALVRSITYRNVGGSAGQRKIEFTISDGDGGVSGVRTKVVNVV